MITFSYVSKASPKIKKWRNKKMKKVIVRADNAGVFYGTLAEQSDKVVKLINARKLYYWEGACAVEQLSLEGVKKPSNCRFTVTVSEILIANWDQIIPCTEKASKSIEGVREWKV
jgi:hypothetical protein